MSGTLQTDYPEVTLEKVTSLPGLPSEKARFVEDWPELTLEDDEKSIHAPYPAWLLTPEGTVKGSNLLAGWLWEEAQPNKLLGSNFSTIFSRNFKRIPKEKNGEFYTKKTSIMKRLEEGHYVQRGYLARAVAFGRNPSVFRLATKGINHMADLGEPLLPKFRPSDPFPILDIHHVDPRPHDVLQRRAGAHQRPLDVAQRLHRLGVGVSRPVDLP